MRIEGKRFLITGGTSLIGSRIAMELLRRGAAHVTLLDNFSLSGPTDLDELLEDARVTLMKGDVLRLDQMIQAAQGCEGVFAIAGWLTVALARDPRLGLDVNITGTLNTFEAARIAGVKKVVTASSIAVYGSAVGGQSTESTGFASMGVAPPRALYALSKLAGEQLGWMYHREHGLGFAAMRYGSVYGERQHDRGVNVLSIIHAYQAIRQGQAPQLGANADSGHDLVYVGDAARASVMAMENDDAVGPYNISSGTTTTIREMAEKVARQMGSTLEPVVQQSGGAAPQRTHGGEAIQVSVSIDKAERDFGWRPEVSVDAGIAKLLAWLDTQATAA